MSAHQLDELLGTREHQGVALQVDGYPYAEADRLLAADVLVVLDEVTDPHNLGAVARSALAAGAGGLVVPRHRSAHVTPAAVKASAGMLELLPVAQVTNVVAFLLRAGTLDSGPTAPRARPPPRISPPTSPAGSSSSSAPKGAACARWSPGRATPWSRSPWTRRSRAST